MPDTWAQITPGIREIGGEVVVPIGGRINNRVAAAAGELFEVVKTSGSQYLVLAAEAGAHRVAPGLRLSRTFAPGDVDPVNDRITIIGHPYETGDGPLRVEQTNILRGDPNLTFALVPTVNDTLTRDVGDWAADGFTAGMQITVSGSASNDGTFTIANVVSATVLDFVGDVFVNEGPSNGIKVVGGALPSGLVPNTDLWIVKVDADTIALAPSPGAANRIKQTGLASVAESDAILVQIADAGTENHSIGGGQGLDAPVGFDLSGVTPAASRLDGSGSILLNPFTNSNIGRVVYSGRAVTVQVGTSSPSIFTWYEI